MAIAASGRASASEDGGRRRGRPLTPSTHRSGRDAERPLLRLLVPCLTVALALAACAPPETQRVRGGGVGADIGNRSGVVEMHAGSEIYPERRCALQGEACTGPLPWSGRDPR